MTAPDDATRDALAEVLHVAVCFCGGLDRHPDDYQSAIRWQADAVLAAGYLPPGQADALRAERDQANARAEEQASRVERLAAQCAEWEWTAPVDPGNASYANGYKYGRRSFEGDLRAALATGAADAHDQRIHLCSQCGEMPASMVKIGTTDGWCTRCLDEAAEPDPAHDQRVRAEGAAEALEQARDDIQARITRFRELDAHPQYMNALNDAWSLVANRDRAARARAEGTT